MTLDEETRESLLERRRREEYQRDLTRKTRLLDRLKQDWVDCRRCELCETRTNVVFGSGNPNADVLVLGEAPGREEDEAGVPFIGDSGDILEDFLKAVCWDREQDVYITNTAACRPTQEVRGEDGKMRIENRPPSRSEREACRSRLLETIYIVDPLLIIAVGKVPAAALLGKVSTVENMHGKLYAAVLEGRHVPIRYTVMPVYHTAFLLRTFDRREDGVWGKSVDDFVLARKIVDHLRVAYYGIETTSKESSDGEATEQEPG